MKSVPILSEQEVLRQLDIPDFRHLTKEKVMSFASMLSNMDPAIAYKALEQFPDFAKTICSLAHEYGDIAKSSLKSNDESMKQYNSIAASNVAAIQKQLEKDDLNFDEKMQIMELLVELQRDVAAKDSENKDFLSNALRFIGGVVLGIAVILLAVLGGNADIKLPYGKK